MTMLTRIVLAVLLCTAATATAHAQPKRPARASKAKPASAKPAKSKSFVFDGDDVDGDRLSPDGDTITTTDPAKHTSLIRVRTSFIPEILKSAEDL
jgi:hypothetical protein